MFFFILLIFHKTLKKTHLFFCKFCIEPFFKKFKIFKNLRNKFVRNLNLVKKNPTKFKKKKLGFFAKF